MFRTRFIRGTFGHNSTHPLFFENIVRDETLFGQLRKCSTKHNYSLVPPGIIDELVVKKEKQNFDQDNYNAFRWVGERSIWLNYLGASPQMWFVRVGNEVWIQWDNVDKKVEGIEVWTARRGTYTLSVEAFRAECHSFSERLLSAMESIIVSIENGSARAKIPLDPASLRNQLLEFKNEFEKSLSATYEPGIDWNEAENAMRTIALNNGITLPE